MADRISHGSAVAAVALAAIVARAIFGLNGSQYDSWVVLSRPWQRCWRSQRCSSSPG